MSDPADLPAGLFAQSEHGRAMLVVPEKDGDLEGGFPSLCRIQERDRPVLRGAGDVSGPPRQPDRPAVPSSSG